jgi:hypothetical protein
VGVGPDAGTPPSPYPPGGAAVVSVVQATEPGGALTEGAVPQALNVVVNDRTTPPPEIIDVYAIGTPVFGATSSDPVPGGNPLAAGTTPVILVAMTPASVTLVVDAGVKGISVAWLPVVIPGWSTE